MIGWVFGIDSLTRLTLNSINMSFPTAVMFFLSALGLFYMNRMILEGDYMLSPLLLSGITLLIFLININILAGSLIGVQTGMENLFINSHDYVIPGRLIAGLPAVSTMVGFLLYGLINIFSLVLGPERQKLIELLSIVIFLMGLSALVGYALQVPIMYFLISGVTIPMALNTALTFLVLGASLFAINEFKIFHET